MAFIEAKSFTDVGDVYFSDPDDDEDVVQRTNRAGGWARLRSAVSAGWRARRTIVKEPAEHSSQAPAEAPSAAPVKPSRVGHEAEDSYFKAIAGPGARVRRPSLEESEDEDDESLHDTESRRRISAVDAAYAAWAPEPKAAPASTALVRKSGMSRCAGGTAPSFSSKINIRHPLPPQQMGHLARREQRPAWASPPRHATLPSTALASREPLGYDRLVSEVFSGDILTVLADLVGLRRLHVLAAVCTAWHDATRAKLREWGVLLYVRTLGRGFGKLRGQFDLPTWLCMVSDGTYGGTALCVVDSCNYRLVVMNPTDGAVLKVIGRPGARFGELSSPSGVACDLKTTPGRPRVFTSSAVGPEDRRLQCFDLETWRMLGSTPEGEGRYLLDAAEGMAVAYGCVYVVDTGHHRVLAFDARTLEKVAQYPPIAWDMARQGRAWDQLNNPMGVAHHEEELFVSDTHNDRIQVFNLQLQWIGQLGQRGRGPGEFVYPRGVAVSLSGRGEPLLYVAEQSRIQALTLLGEPRVIVPVPGASNLCGLCCDGQRVFVSDMDAHVVHMLRLTHTERWQEKRREAIAEAKARKSMRGGAEGAGGGADDGGAAGRRQERSEKERQRDCAVKAVLSGRTTQAMLGLPSDCRPEAARQAVRLAMRVLHPDAGINIRLKGTPQYEKIVAAFKKVNNIKDERIEAWFAGEAMG